MDDVQMSIWPPAADNSIYYRLTMNHDAQGKFHHYQVWRAIRGVTAFLSHVADLVPGTTSDQAHAFCNIMLGQDAT